MIGERQCVDYYVTEMVEQPSKAGQRKPGGDEKERRRREDDPGVQNK